MNNELLSEEFKGLKRKWQMLRDNADRMARENYVSGMMNLYYENQGYYRAALEAHDDIRSFMRNYEAGKFN